MRLRSCFSKYYLLFFVCCFFSCKKKSVLWTVENVYSNTSIGLSDVYFLSDSIGFACGGNRYSEATILKTLDAGTTWSSVSLPNDIDQKQLYGIAGLSSGTIISVGFGGVTFTSTDSGSSWNAQQEQFWREWQDVAFKNISEAYFCGRGNLDDGYITTINANWNGTIQNATTHTFAMTDIDFVTEDVGYISGFGAVYKTEDGGQSWQFTNALNDYFTAMVWDNKNIGWIIGWEGSICKTDNGGQGWQVIRNANRLAQAKKRFKCIDKLGDELMIGGEKGVVFYSNDNGEQWSELNPFTTENIEQLIFYSNDIVVAVTHSGSIFKLYK